MNRNIRKATALTLILVVSTILLSALGSLPANAQTTDQAIVIVQNSTGGTTIPAAGNYSYTNGTNIVLTATPDLGYVFQYWIASGSYTPGHSTGLPSYIIDPDTGAIIGTFPSIPSVSGIDSLVFTRNPTNITCGYGYTYTYQAVFAASNATVPTNSTAVVVILPSTFGTTNPAAGTYTYNAGTNITLLATPISGYAFHYWVVSGNFTPGHVQPLFNVTYIVDPDTGQIIGGIPRPTIPSGMDSLVFSINPANVTCGYGNTFTYEAVFTPATSASPSPTSTATVAPTATIAPTASPTVAPTAIPSASPTATPQSTTGDNTTIIIVAAAIVVIIIIVAVVALMMRRKK